MRQTMAEKLLARASGQPGLRSGEIVEVDLDWIMTHEGIGWGVGEAVEKLGATKLANPDKVVALIDHFSPPPDEAAANLHRVCREFADRFEIKEFLDMKKGVCHQVMVEDYVSPGDIVVGSDSHTTMYGALGCFSTGLGFTDIGLSMVSGRTWFKVPESIRFDLQGKLAPGVSAKDVALDLLGKLKADGATYRSCEYGGEGLQSLSVESRLTLTCQSAEMGCKVALMPADDQVMAYLERKGRSVQPDAVVVADDDAVYFKRMTVDLSAITPRVAAPHSPDNVFPVAETDPVKVDQVFIGGCVNGRIEDMRAAARILRGRTLPRGVRLLVVPASYQVLKAMSAEGVLDVFVDVGAIIGPSTCGPCFGGHFGLLAAGEVCVSTATRNFVGRMGSKKASLYLASPETAAATAVTGRLTDPREFVQ